MIVSNWFSLNLPSLTLYIKGKQTTMTVMRIVLDRDGVLVMTRRVIYPLTQIEFPVKPTRGTETSLRHFKGKFI